MPRPVAYSAAAPRTICPALTDHGQRRDDGWCDAGSDDERGQCAHDEGADVRAGLLLVARHRSDASASRSAAAACRRRTSRSASATNSSANRTMIHGCWKNACGACLNASTKIAPAAAYVRAMPCTYVKASEKPRMRVTLAPCPTMMPERIGIIGSTHGVSDSSNPAPKNVQQCVRDIAVRESRSPVGPARQRPVHRGSRLARRGGDRAMRRAGT